MEITVSCVICVAVLTSDTEESVAAYSKCEVICGIIEVTLCKSRSNR